MRAALLTILIALLVPACGNDPDQPGPDAAGIDAATPPEPLDVTGPLGRIDFAYALDVTEHDLTGETRSYVLASGALPPGLVLDPSGTLDGTPLASGAFAAVLHGEGPCAAEVCRLVVNLRIEVAPIILLSGYGPFAGVPENPSYAAVEPLDGTLIAGHDVRVLELVVEWEAAPEEYLAEYERLQPVLAIASGVAMGENVVRLESIAHNLANGEDVAGVTLNGPIDPAGPETLATNLPLTDLLDVFESEGYPVAISDDAGDYLCNYLFYKLMARVLAEPAERRILGGFIHVTGANVVTPEEMTRAWVWVIERLVAYRADLQAKRRRPGDRAVVPTVHHAPRY
jgi:pyroglutamyl-peptidase